MVSGDRSLFRGARDRAATLTSALCLIALLGCTPEATNDEPIVRPVRYMQAEAAAGIQNRTYSGSVRAEREADLSFRVSGTLVSRPINVGDSLAAGALVGELDPTDYQVRVEEAEAGLAQSEAALRNTQAIYDRTRDLYENRNASLSELDAARAADESARASVNAAAQQLEAARLQRSYTRLVAPEQCDVAQVFAEENQNVSAGQAVLRVNCGQCAEVVVSVPEVDIGRIEQGAAVLVTIGALGGTLLSGVVQDVGVATAGTGTTYPVTVALQDGCDDVRSGMAADVEFAFDADEAEGAVFVPLIAVGEDRNGQRFVFVLESGDQENYRASRRNVEVGEPSQSGLTILSGLEEGELIATAGVRRLLDGQEVRLLANSGDSPED